MVKILIAILLLTLVSQCEIFYHERNIIFVYEIVLITCVMNAFRLLSMFFE